MSEYRRLRRFHGAQLGLRGDEESVALDGVDDDDDLIEGHEWLDHVTEVAVGAMCVSAEGNHSDEQAGSGTANRRGRQEFDLACQLFGGCCGFERGRQCRRLRAISSDGTGRYVTDTMKWS